MPSVGGNMYRRLGLTTFNIKDALEVKEVKYASKDIKAAKTVLMNLLNQQGILRDTAGANR